MTQALVAGSLHLDVVVRAPRLPALDETLMGQSVDYRFGGKGGNQAVAAARMGAAVEMAGCIGNDDFGARLRETLDDFGVGHAQVRTLDDAPSGMSVAIIDAQGDYGAVVVSGANLHTDADMIAIPDGTRVLCLQNEIPEPVSHALAERARAAGITVILNAAPARALETGLLGATDVLVVNRVEAAQMLGEDALNGDALTFPDGPDHIVLTLGADGLIWHRRDSAPQAMPAFAVKPVSSHGAGDMFTGALAADLARGAAMQDALRFAQAAAALMVALPDGDRQTLSRDRVVAFLQAQTASR